ncbi:hypothetical protein AB8A05_04250 [Tardiphaga sp. 538_B7_N1_4]|uniref:hypothetical protein n=1 Tax=Tardiphaga sp. 538_B7_N1_4 TaxID=3240778 RepID=UPI003F1F1346
MNPISYEPSNADCVSINAAIDVAVLAGGGRVQLPAAVYSPNDFIRMKPNVHLSGTRGASIIRLTSAMDDQPVIWAPNSTLVSISDLTIDAGDIYAGPNSGAIGLGPGHGASVRGVEILRMGRMGIIANGISDFVFSDNYIKRDAPLHTLNNGIQIINGMVSAQGVIKNNRIVNTGSIYNVYQTLIEGNNVSGAGYGAGIALVGADTSAYNRVVNNLCCGSVGQDADGFWVKGIENWSALSYFSGNQTNYNSGSGFCQGGWHGVINGHHSIGNGINEPPGIGVLIAFSAAYAGHGTFVNGCVTQNMNGKQCQNFWVQPGLFDVTQGVNFWG